MSEQDWHTRFECFDTAHIGEILASMEDSDRYISWPTKERLIKELKQELSMRAKYSTPKESKE